MNEATFYPDCKLESVSEQLFSYIVQDLAMQVQILDSQLLFQTIPEFWKDTKIYTLLIQDYLLMQNQGTLR